MGDGQLHSIKPTSTSLHLGSPSPETNKGGIHVPPKNIGATTSPSSVQENSFSLRIGGAILKGFGAIFTGAAYLTNAVINVAAVIVVGLVGVPTAIGVGLGSALVGGVLGAIADMLPGDRYESLASQGVHKGFKLGSDLVLGAAELPFLFLKLTVAGFVGGIGLGLAKLGGADPEDINSQLDTHADLLGGLEEKMGISYLLGINTILEKVRPKTA